jgi:hypothetical protein
MKQGMCPCFTVASNTYAHGVIFLFIKEVRFEKSYRPALECVHSHRTLSI